MSEKLKIFVIGETSPNPEDWGGELSWALVLASSAEEAKTLAPEANGEPMEIAQDVPKVLTFQPGNGGWPD